VNEPRDLVEHFFRHEFGRLVAVLTGSLGVRRLELVEDVVQTSLVQALETWSRRGVPDDLAGWLSAADCHRAIFAGWLGPGRVGLIAGWPVCDRLCGVVDYYTS